MRKGSICVIPARGGSKRIPRKNIRKFLKRPLIEWSIKAALKSNCFEHVIVSTDDDEIEKISKECGALVPFKREKELADDYTGTIDVIRNEIIKLTNIGINFEDVCCIYATAPFVTTRLIKTAKKRLEESNNSYVVTGTKFDYPIQRALRRKKNDKYEIVELENLTKRSQDLEEMYHDAGQLYWASTNVWMNKHNIFDNASLLVLPSWRVQDIDTEEDWLNAEIKLECLIKRGLHE